MGMTSYTIAIHDGIIKLALLATPPNQDGSKACRSSTLRHPETEAADDKFATRASNLFAVQRQVRWNESASDGGGPGTPSSFPESHWNIGSPGLAAISCHCGSGRGSGDTAMIISRRKWRYGMVIKAWRQPRCCVLPSLSTSNSVIPSGSGTIPCRRSFKQFDIFIPFLTVERKKTACFGKRYLLGTPFNEVSTIACLFSLNMLWCNRLAGGLSVVKNAPLLFSCATALSRKCDRSRNQDQRHPTMGSKEHERQRIPCSA